MNYHFNSDLNICVDYFVKKNTKDIEIFFLTHAHSDHLKGFKGFDRILYCTKQTYNFLKEMYNFDDISCKFIFNEIELNKPIKCNNFEYEAIDANHDVPGAIMLIFRKNNQYYLL